MLYYFAVMLVLNLDLGLSLRTWYVLNDLSKVLGLDDEVLGLGLALSICLEIVHQADSQVIVNVYLATSARVYF